MLSAKTAEQYSSSRRLPSRLFSSTRRLFGASSTAPATPTHGSSPSTSSMNSRFKHGPNSSVSSIASVTSISAMGGGNVNEQRRLAEFATILGDYKLAISVWETLRKEGKGGSVRAAHRFPTHRLNIVSCRTFFHCFRHPLQRWHCTRTMHSQR